MRRPRSPCPRHRGGEERRGARRRNIGEARRLASTRTCSRRWREASSPADTAAQISRSVFSRIGFIMMETLDRRAAAGSGGEGQSLEFIAAAIDRAVAEKRLPDGNAIAVRRIAATPHGVAARPRRKATGAPPTRSSRASCSASRRCAPRPSNKAARNRRRSPPPGKWRSCSIVMACRSARSRCAIRLARASASTPAGSGARRSTNACQRSACSAIVKCGWRRPRNGAIRYVFFGLPADVEAAHYLYDLIVVTFATETARFKNEDMIIASSERRVSTRSFQIGLAHGICDKLKSIESGARRRQPAFDGPRPRADKSLCHRGRTGEAWAIVSRQGAKPQAHGDAGRLPRGPREPGGNSSRDAASRRLDPV